MSHLVVIAFDDDLKADEALLAAYRLEREHVLALDSAAIVVRDKHGKLRYRETNDMRPGQGALVGSFWGLLFGLVLFVPLIGLAAGAGIGALAAKLRDGGISDEFQKEVGETMQPGTSAIFFLVDDAILEDVLAEARRFEGGKVLHSDLDPEAEAALREAIEGAAVEQAEDS